jgi:hypothetical protein
MSSSDSNSKSVKAEHAVASAASVGMGQVGNFGHPLHPASVHLPIGVREQLLLTYLVVLTTALFSFSPFLSPSTLCSSLPPSLPASLP